jgi:hypothetical protein
MRGTTFDALIGKGKKCVQNFGEEIRIKETTFRHFRKIAKKRL